MNLGRTIKTTNDLLQRQMDCAGDDTITSGAGDDTISGGDGGDEIDAGEGWDLVDFAGSNIGVRAGLDDRLGADVLRLGRY